MTHFKIIYKNGNRTLTIENRTHETDVLPSSRMVVNALHSVCLKNDVTNFNFAKAEVYRNGSYLTSYRLTDEA